MMSSLLVRLPSPDALLYPLRESQADRVFVLFQSTPTPLDSWTPIASRDPSSRDEPSSSSPTPSDSAFPVLLSESVSSFTLFSHSPAGTSVLIFVFFSPPSSSRSSPSVLENGSVLASGSPQDLKDSNVFPEDALADSGADDHDHEESGETAAEGGELEALAAEEDGEIDLEAAKKLKEKRESKKLVKEETSATGGVSADVYKVSLGGSANRSRHWRRVVADRFGSSPLQLYMSSMGSLTFWIFLVVLFLGSQYTQVGTNL
jgi:hypothetical protein